MQLRYAAWPWAILAMATLPGTATAVSVQDDMGNTVTLTQPARRIVSLAPHVTELLFAAGAGQKIVGASNFSDYPDAAKNIPSVGSFAALDLERVLTLKPDLIVAWHSGNKPSQLARLRAFNIPIYESQPGDFPAIASSLERLSALTGTEDTGKRAAADFRQRWHTLQDRYAGRAPVSVFYQIWSQPLMTLNGQHMASSVLRLCGGKNIFADLPQLAPTVNVEAVIAVDPQVIMTPSDARDQPLDQWKQYSRLQAVRDKQLYTINADWMNRAGPRVLDAAGEVCRRLDEARAPRK